MKLNLMKKRLKITSLFVLFTSVIFGQADSTIQSNWKFKIDSTYTELIKMNKITGASIAIVQGGKIVYAEGFGFQNKTNGIKADANTIYRIGSITKSFTGVAIMQLQEKGKLKVEDPIQNYLPQLKIQSRFTNDNSIRICDMMSHTSGLPSDLTNGFFCDNPPTIDWVIEQLNKCTMSAPARYQHSYSNVGYGVLGKLIEAVSGQEYDAYIKEHIFKIMDMKSSGVKFDESYNAQISKGYVDGKEMDETQITDIAAGLISSSVLDMGNYMNMFMANGKAINGEVLTSNSIQEMMKNRTADITLPTTIEWGYGLYSNKISIVSDSDTLNTKIVGHGGDTWAFHADFQFIPELNVGAVILTNSDNGVKITSARNLIRQYLKETEGKKLVSSLDSLNRVIANDIKCVPSEVLGTYVFSGIRMDVKNVEKIKMNQGAHKIVLSAKNDSLVYTGKVKLFKLIPMKIKNQEFKFVKHGDQVYFKAANAKTKAEEYISKKSVSKETPESWRKMLGKYESVGDKFECKDCPYMDFGTLEVKLKEKKGQLVGYIKGKSKDTKSFTMLEVVSDDICVTPGIGRNTGETVRILENGNLFYSGFELKKL